MLEAAKLYESQLNDCYGKIVINSYYKWIHLQYPEPTIKVDDNFWNKIQLVSTNEGIVKGYFSASWKRPDNYIDGITCINFKPEEDKNIFAADIRRFLRYLVNDVNTPKIEWIVVIGSPSEKHYDKFIERFDGRIVGIEKYANLIGGKYYDSKLYEWINDYYECTHCGNKEKKEREVMCWKCGLGEMVYHNPFMKGKY